MNQFRFSGNRMVNEKFDFFQKSNFFGHANNAADFCSSQVRDLAGLAQKTLGSTRRVTDPARAQGSRRSLRRLRPFALSLLLLAFVLAGCGDAPTDAAPPTLTPDRAAQVVPTFTPTGESAPVITASAQETATPTATPTDASTATPTPTSTPTPLPSALLNEGLRLLRIGDYGPARLAFAQLLAPDQADASLRVSAAYHMVLAYLQDGDDLGTLTALEQFNAEAEGAALANDHAYATDALFLRGEALADLGRYAEALTAFQGFLAARPDLAQVTQVEIGHTYAALGDVAQAAAAYQAAADAATDRIAQVQLLEDVAQYYVDNNLNANAVQAYDAILARSVNVGYRTQIHYLAGQALAVAGDETAAIQRWQAATAEDPTSRYAYQALIELVSRQVPFDLYQRGYIDLMSSAWVPAVNAYQAFLDQADPADPKVALALHGMGQAYLGADNTAAAQSLFDRVLADYPDCACAGQAWMDKARSFAAAGDNAGARRTYRTFAGARPGDALAAEALWQSGLLAMRDGNQIEAAVDFLALADGFPSSKRAPDALYAIALGAQRSGLTAQAIIIFQRLQSDYPTHKWSAVGYWLGRAHYERRENVAAQAQWRIVAGQEPDGYYGVLAGLALQSTSAGNSPQGSGGSLLASVADVAGPASTLAGDDGSQGFAETWLAGWLPNVAAPSILSATVAQDPDLIMGRALLDLQRRGEALDALERVRLRYQDNPQAVYALMLEFERLGAYRHSLLAAWQLVNLSPATLTENAPVFVQRRIYPRPFAELIESEAQKHAIDSLLLFSLIRQESLFEEGARSYAAAQGLAQIIPDTAVWVAEQMGYPNFSNDLIYRPVINVQFGAFYLDWVRDYLDGNLISALVGYNAGPGNADYWREISGPDDTLFVEILNVNEPRIYVQAIVSNLYHYARLYR
ncbi:MAG: transglycosylase SLT domain-containing protein [Caldilineaceae bacterium]|nr:transglycosylase SLT domain-containing protein [Caldilineaceae bacterium]MBP8109788.1 transglycosylase SLT domain-containing protein [Caldilineaceae bacterium]MBP8124729.1 transglycosylase SLT domain-containing protein [Caldilineaceae bacterium]MBP9074582.1 transglycosylase SLT domain-containing protein [Caldilineaceae bacterium]